MIQFRIYFANNIFKMIGDKSVVTRTMMTTGAKKISDNNPTEIPFCATICKVYATPFERTPAYKIGIHAAAS